MTERVVLPRLHKAFNMANSLSFRQVDKLIEKDLPVFFKTQQSAFFECNKKFLSVINIPSLTDIKNKTDRDIHYHQQACSAEYFIRGDLMAMQGHGYINGFEILAANDSHARGCYVSKKPILLEGRVVGIAGLMTIVSKARHPHTIQQSNHPLIVAPSGLDLNKIPAVKNVTLPSINQNLIMNGTYHLTEEQVLPLHLFACGYKKIKIAELLNLSVQGVGYHIDRIKENNNLQNKNELYSMASHLNLHETSVLALDSYLNDDSLDYF